MAKRIDTIERDGRKLNVYDNGMEQDAVTGKIVTRPPSVAFTSATGRSAAKKRQEKMQRSLRQNIVETYNGVMPNPAKNSAEAFAGAMAMLFEQVGLNSEAYPRDRIEVMDKIGKYTGLVSDKRESEDEAAVARMNAYAAGANMETTRLMLQILKDVQRLQNGLPIEGKLIE